MNNLYIYNLHTLYDKIWIPKWLIGIMKWPSRKLEWHLGKTRSYIKSWRAQHAQNALWATVVGRENISPIRLILKKMTFNWTRLQCVIMTEDLQDLRIYKARWCKQRNFPIGECKSIDGFMNLDFTHSVQDSIIEWQHPGEILSKPRIQWPKGNQKAIWTNLDQELSFTLTTNLKGPNRQLISLILKLYITFVLSGFAQ